MEARYDALPCRLRPGQGVRRQGREGAGATRRPWPPRPSELRRRGPGRQRRGVPPPARSPTRSEQLIAALAEAQNISVGAGRPAPAGPGADRPAEGGRGRAPRQAAEQAAAEAGSAEDGQAEGRATPSSTHATTAGSGASGDGSTGAPVAARPRRPSPTPRRNQAERSSARSPTPRRSSASPTSGPPPARTLRLLRADDDGLARGRQVAAALLGRAVPAEHPRSAWPTLRPGDLVFWGNTAPEHASTTSRCTSATARSSTPRAPASPCRSTRCTTGSRRTSSPAPDRRA